MQLAPLAGQRQHQENARQFGCEARRASRHDGRTTLGKYRVTVDTGGTFSDFVCLDEDTGAISIAKLPATPDDPSRAILRGIETLRAGAGTPPDITVSAP